MFCIKPSLLRLLAALIILPLAANAQQGEPYVYGELGYGRGAEGMLKIAINTVFAHNNILTLNYCFASKRADNLPPDYNPNDLLGKHWPQKSISMAGISYGKMIFSTSPMVRFSLKAGVVAGVINMPTDFVPVPQNGGWFSLTGPGQYNYSMQRDFAIGLVLDPTVELPLGRDLGITAGPYLNLNAQNPIVAFDVCVAFGRIRGKPGRTGI